MIAAEDITPSLERVGQANLRRTVNGRGKPTGTFDDSTTPTAEGAQIHIDAAARWIANQLSTIGTTWPASLTEMAADAVAQDAALRIESGSQNPDGAILDRLERQATASFAALKATFQADQHQDGRMGSITMVSPYSGDPDPAEVIDLD